MTSSWNPWNFIQFKWLAMEKNVYYLPCYKNVIIWNHPTENQPRMSRAIDFLFQGVPLNHMFLQFLLRSYTPLASFEGGPSLERSDRQQLNELLQLEKAPKKSTKSPWFTTNISQKKKHGRIRSLFSYFFFSELFSSHTWIFAQICQMS